MQVGRRGSVMGTDGDDDEATEWFVRRAKRWIGALGNRAKVSRENCRKRDDGPDRILSLVDTGAMVLTGPQCGIVG